MDFAAILLQIGLFETNLLREFKLIKVMLLILMHISFDVKKKLFILS